MNLRSPLSRVLGSGSAKEGTDHWWAQRLSAAALALLGCWFALALLRIGSFDYAAVLAFVARPLNAVLLLLLLLTMAYHSVLGIQVIIEDYVHAPFAKVAALVTSKFLHVFVALAGVFSVLRIAFGVHA